MDSLKLRILFGCYLSSPLPGSLWWAFEVAVPAQQSSLLMNFPQIIFSITMASINTSNHFMWIRNKREQNNLLGFILWN